MWRPCILMVALSLPVPLAAQMALGVGAGGAQAGDPAGPTGVAFAETRSGSLYAMATFDVMYVKGSNDGHVLDERTGECYTRTGGYASSGECMRVDGGGALELGFALPAGRHHVHLGGGYRQGAEPSAFGAAALHVGGDGPRFMFAANAGPDLIRGLVLLAFPVGR